MDYWVETALRPLRRYADFRGRSTRSEFAAFYVLMSVVSFGASFLFGMLSPLFDFRAEWVAREIVQYFFLCPILAISVRRFHDQGKSGWWLLLVLPAVAGNAWTFYRSGFSLDPIAQLEHPLSGAVQGLIAACLLVYLVLLIWKDEEGPNRYGPNPRYDAPEPEQPAAADAQPFSVAP